MKTWQDSIFFSIFIFFLFSELIERLRLFSIYLTFHTNLSWSWMLVLIPSCHISWSMETEGAWHLMMSNRGLTTTGKDLTTTGRGLTTTGEVLDILSIPGLVFYILLHVRFCLFLSIFKASRGCVTDHQL